MWPAHAVTLLRLPLAIAFWFAVDAPRVALAIVVAVAVTDAIDGNLARWLKRRGHTAPDIGGWLDPLVDKLFVAIAIAAIWWHTRATLVVILVGARELVLIPLVAIYLAQHRSTGKLRADWLGKVATIAQFVALAVVVAYPDAELLAIGVAALAAVLGLAAAVHYVIVMLPRDAR